MANIEVREIKSDEYHVWDKLVTDSPQGTVFHLSDWVTTCAFLTHKQPLLLGYYEDDHLTGGCSLYVTKKPIFRSSAVSTAPMTPYGGYLLSNSVSTKVREKETRNKSTISALSDEISKLGFSSVNIINAPAFQDVRPLTWNNWTCRVYYTYVLHLSEDISSHISKKARNTIKNGQKNGIDVRKCYDPELYWDLTVSTYEKQNRKPPFTKAFLMGMLDMIINKNLGEMWVASTPAGETASAEVVTWDNHMAHRWSAASNFTHRDTGATSLLLFEIFQDLQEKGFNSINLMAGNTPQLSMFVSSFNPELIPYYGVEKNQCGFGISNFSRKIWNTISKVVLNPR
jgi:uncharacterized protein (UPF0297 family)